MVEMKNAAVWMILFTIMLLSGSASGDEPKTIGAVARALSIAATGGYILLPRKPDIEIVSGDEARVAGMVAHRGRNKKCLFVLLDPDTNIPFNQVDFTKLTGEWRIWPNRGHWSAAVMGTNRAFCFNYHDRLDPDRNFCVDDLAAHGLSSENAAMAFIRAALFVQRTECPPLEIAPY